MKRKIKLLLSLCLIICTAMLAGCSNEAEDASPQPTASSNPTKQADTSSKVTLELPKEYPSDLVPLMEGYELTNVKEVAGRFQVTYEIEKSFEETQKFYADLFPDTPKQDETGKRTYSYATLNKTFALNTLQIISVAEEKTEVFIYIEPK